MSVVIAGLGVGGALLSPVITHLILRVGWRMSRLYVSLIFLSVVIPIIWFVMKNTPDEMGTKPYGEPLQEDEGKKKITVNRSTVRTSDDAADLSVKESKSKLFYYLFMGGMFASGIICGGGIQHLNPYVSDLHGSVFAGTIVSVYAMAGIAGKMTLGWMHDRFGSNQSLMFGGFIFGTSFLMLAAFGESRGIILLAAVFFGFGVSIGSINANLIPFSVFGMTHYAEVLGISKGVQQAGMAAGPVLLALVYDTAESYQWVWYVCLLITLMTVCFLIWSDYQSRLYRKQKSRG